MTAAEIRAIQMNSTMEPFLAFEMLREIAAQLAELNERLTPGNFEVNIYDCSFEDSKRAGGSR